MITWLSQTSDEEQQRQASELPVPPAIPVAPAPTRRQWTNVEKIMLASLALNLLWFTVYAVRSGAVHFGGD